MDGVALSWKDCSQTVVNGPGESARGWPMYGAMPRRRRWACVYKGRGRAARTVPLRPQQPFHLIIGNRRPHLSVLFLFFLRVL